MKRKVPRMATDEEARAFLDQNLSNLDFPQFKPARYEFAKKSARVTMRLPKALLVHQFFRTHLAGAFGLVHEPPNPASSR